MEHALQLIGRIDIEKYQVVTDKPILSDEVIITDNRIEHIVSRRGREFYDNYSRFFREVIEEPDYIFSDSRKDTAIAAKSFICCKKTINIVIRLVVEGDDVSFKNSIITAIGENDKRFEQRLRNHPPVYQKKIDKNE